MRALYLSLAVVACFAASAPAQPERLSSTEADRVVYALSAWLAADDFDPGELAALTRYGQAVVPSLVAALNGGPSSARRERLRRSLDSSYDSLREQASKDPGRKIPSREDYLKHYLGNFEALYRVRAAQALAAIGGPEARKAVEAAAATAGRDDARAAFREALKEIK